MGIFDKLFGRDKGVQKKGNVSSKDIMEFMLDQAVTYIDAGRPEQAVDLYQRILEIEPKHPTALYNLGSLYAQGKGVAQDFLEAGCLFRQAELNGDTQAGKLCQKCLMDYMHQRMERGSASELYADVLQFIRRVYPEANAEVEANRKLFALAGLHFNRGEYAPAAKLLRPAAEFGNDGLSQNYLAVLYNLGGGVGKNDLAALYWFDRAVDNGAEVARKDRDGILNAYRSNFPAEELKREMLQLSEWCDAGTEEIPRDTVKAAYWRKMAESKDNL